MANVSRPNGFRPVRSLADGWDGMIETYAVLAADATALFVGDVVKLSGAADALGLAAITRCTANTAPRVRRELQTQNLPSSRASVVRQ